MSFHQTIALSAGFFLLLSPAYAPADPGDFPETCDPEFQAVLDNRAFLQGSQDLEMAQTLLFKPDSTLEYSCFKQRAATQQGGAATIIPSLNAYMAQNFNHPLAGGHGIAPSGLCDSMFLVWDFMKCQNFDKDNFKTLAAWAGAADTRTKPEICVDFARAGNINAALAAANPPPDELPTYPQAFGNAPANFVGAPACDAFPPIPTGLMARTPGIYADNEFPEKVCISPGCTYDPGLLGDRCAPIN